MTPALEQLKALVAQCDDVFRHPISNPCDTRNLLGSFLKELSALIPQIEREMQAAVESEREACAMEATPAETCDCEICDDRRKVSDVIRSRGPHDALDKMLAEARDKADRHAVEVTENNLCAIMRGELPAMAASDCDQVAAALAEAQRDRERDGQMIDRIAAAIREPTMGIDKTIGAALDLRDAALIEECLRAIANLTVYVIPNNLGRWLAVEQVTGAIGSVCSNAARTLERVKLEARIQEADFWEHTINAPGESISGEQRLADLKAQLAKLEKENV